MERNRLFIGVAMVLVALVGADTGHAAPSRSQTASRKDIPAPLLPWVDWVLRGHEEAACPRLPQTADGKCVWPHALSVDVDDQGGEFTLKVRVDADGMRVNLPGGSRRWPLDVTVDRKDAVVRDALGAPVIDLDAGKAEIKGKFLWDRLPESLTIPADVALVKLRVRGKERRLFERDGSVLWLEKQRKDEAQEDRIEVTVHRKVIDGVPLIVTTRISLEVSGAGREESLGPVLLTKMTPLRLSSPLPARLDDTGRIRVQVRPGTHVIEFDAYLAEAKETLELPASAVDDDVWPPREVWVFEAAPDLRTVRVEGQSVDPTQTRLPPHWQTLPAYALKAGESLRLVEERRGDSDPGPDRLNLQRTMWLDFDGKGMTVRDRIGGALRRSRRLEMSPPTVLGRVEAFGADQFITRLDDDASGRVGVELRAQTLDLAATSRIEGNLSVVPAVSWNHDFSSAQSVLNLPPGWRLITATGVDSVSDSWMKTWTLLELFFLLIVTLGFFRLFGVVWAAVAFVGLAILIPESNAPQWIFAFCLLGEGLARVIPTGPFLIAARALRGFFLVILVAISIPFIVGQIRVGMYPALEDRGYSSPSFSNELLDFADDAPGAAGGLSGKKSDKGKQQARMAKKIAAPSQALSSLESVALDGLVQRQRVDDNSTYQMRLRDFDPKASVQTGPGIPAWSWRSVNLRWSGPVQKDQSLHLYLMSPRAGFAVALVRVGLLLLLLLCLFRLPGRFWPPALKRKLGEHTALFAIPLLFAGLGLSSSSAAAQEIPNETLLSELRTRLLTPPSCSPECITLGSMKLVASDDDLRLILDVDVAAPQAMILPGTDAQWLATKVVVDNKPATALARDGDRLILPLSEGRHRVILEGRLPRRDTVQVRLHQPPHHATASVDGWTLNGIHEDGHSDVDLQLARVRQERKRSTDGAEAEIEAAPLPPLVNIRRDIALNLDWEVETTVTRLSPLGQAIVIEIPLLDGEHVTTEGVRVQEGKAQINMGAGQSRLQWTSALQERPELTLKAAKDVQWVETWNVTASPLWHVEFDGIAPMHDEAGNGQTFSPWPTESLAVKVTRPHGVEGQTRTVEKASFRFTPGLRATDTLLMMTLRSSLGGPHAVKIPDGAELVEVSIDGKPQPIRQQGKSVALPMVPGQQSIALKWRENVGLGTQFKTPAIDIGLPLVNAGVEVNVPSNRWVLFVWGPVLGPAVLFWSLLVIVLLCAVALSRVPFSPLSLLQWILLGVGLTQVPLVVSAFIAAWLLLLGNRKARPDLDPLWFDARQLLIVVMTFFSLVLLIFAIQDGLLGSPDMQIRGNDSSQSALRWSVDRTNGEAPAAYILSVPMFVYRILMLLWALWLAWSVVRWLREGWQAFRLGGFWKVPPSKKPDAPPSGPSGPSSGPGPSGPQSPGAPSGNPTPIGAAGLRPQDAPPRRSTSSRLLRDEGSGPIEMLYDAAGTLPPTAANAPLAEVPLELPSLGDDDDDDVPAPPASLDDERS